jgi:hypothetical protein
MCVAAAATFPPLRAFPMAVEMPQPQHYKQHFCVCKRCSGFFTFSFQSVPSSVAIVVRLHDVASSWVKALRRPAAALGATSENNSPI